MEQKIRQSIKEKQLKVVKDGVENESTTLEVIDVLSDVDEYIKECGYG